MGFKLAAVVVPEKSRFKAAELAKFDVVECIQFKDRPGYHILLLQVPSDVDINHSTYLFNLPPLEPSEMTFTVHEPDIPIRDYTDIVTLQDGSPVNPKQFEHPKWEDYGEDEDDGRSLIIGKIGNLDLTPLGGGHVNVLTESLIEDDEEAGYDPANEPLPEGFDTEDDRFDSETSPGNEGKAEVIPISSNPTYESPPPPYSYQWPSGKK